MALRNERVAVQRCNIADTVRNGEAGGCRGQGRELGAKKIRCCTGITSSLRALPSLHDENACEASKQARRRRRRRGRAGLSRRTAPLRSELQLEKCQSLAKSVLRRYTDSYVCVSVTICHRERRCGLEDIHWARAGPAVKLPGGCAALRI